MANKFNGILICTDLDDTLLSSSDGSLSEENKRAIEYFMAEGGLFTVSTGRAPFATDVILKKLTPNAPLVCFNGGSIYDHHSNRILWGEYLDKSVTKLLEHIEATHSELGIEVFTDNNIYFCKENAVTPLHHFHEDLPYNYLDYHNIFANWKKVIILADPSEIPSLIEEFSLTPFAKDFDFTASFEYYLEIMPKGISKGESLLKLTNLLKISDSKTIGVGNYYNDVPLIKTAGIGIAVANAVDEARNCADIVTVDSDSSALSAIITSLDFGLIKF